MTRPAVSSSRIPKDLLDRVRAAHDLVATIEAEGLELRRVGSSLKGPCPFHEESTPSLDVSPERQTFKCFGCGAQGDVVDWVQRRRGLGFREAVDELAGAAGIDLGTPSPSSNGAPPASRRWTIRDAGGNVVAEHERVDEGPGPDGKRRKRFVWWCNGRPGLNGTKAADLPLYGVEHLAGRPNDGVVLVEGEKAADALRTLGYLAVGTVTGASSTPSTAALEPLRGRAVVIWPDADEVGRAHMRRVGALLEDVAESILVAEVPGAADGADAADVDEARAVAAIDAAVPFPGPIESAPASPKLTTPPARLKAAGQHVLADVGNALRLRDAHGADLRHSKALGWLTWDGRRWIVDAEKNAIEYAKDAADRILEEARGSGLDADAKKATAGWWLKSQGAHAVRNMLAMAESLPGIAARPEDFDRDPFAFNVRNGTIDLRTGELRPHRREDLGTRLAPVDFDPGATCPRWDAFLEMVQPDPEVRAYLCRRSGAAMIGETGARWFDVDYGTGANGKSMFSEVLAAVLGDYCGRISVASLVDKRDRAGNTPELAGLVGTRLVLASEPGERVQLNMATVKAITGGDAILVCRKHKDPFAYTPVFKLVLATNHEPAIEGGSEGEWSRVVLVPWRVRIPRERERPFETVKAELLEEAPGILAWLVRGCLDYQRIGRAPTGPVAQATETYRRQEDPFSGFLADECDLAPWRFAAAGPLIEAYNRWTEENDLPACSRQMFGREMDRKGFRKAKQREARGYFGLSLKTESTREPGED